MKLEVKTAKQTSVVTEKEQYYLFIGEGEHKFAINIGQSTYEKINNLIKPENNTEKEIPKPIPKK